MILSPLKFLFIISLLLFLSCKNESQIQQEVMDKNSLELLDSKKIIIAGTIDAPLGIHKLKISSKDGINDIVFDSLNFQVEMEENFPILISIHEQNHRSIPVFAMPGDSIHVNLSLDGILFEEHSHQYKGDRFKENEVLVELEKILSLDNPKFRNHFNIPEEEFLYLIDSLKHHGNSVKEKLCKTKNIENPYFDYSTKVFLEYKLAQLLKMYPSINKRYFKKKDLKLSDEYNAVLKNLTFEDPRLLNHFPYFYYLVNEVNGRSGFASDWALKFVAIDSLYSDSEIKNHLKFYIAKADLGIFNQFKKSDLNLNQIEVETDKPRIGRNSFPVFDLKKRFETNIEVYKATNPPNELLSKIESSYETLIE